MQIQRCHRLTPLQVLWIYEFPKDFGEFPKKKRGSCTWQKPRKMAEKVGFEPTNRFTGYTISNRAPSTKLGDFSKYSVRRLAAAFLISWSCLFQTRSVIIAHSFAFVNTFFPPFASEAGFFFFYGIFFAFRDVLISLTCFSRSEKSDSSQKSVDSRSARVL